jgi:exodeoxyribonuclease VII large subunit
VARHRGRLHQLLRELRAGARRQIADGDTRSGAHAGALERAGGRAAGADRARRRRDLERLALALAAHDPQRTMARGYAMVTDRDGAPLGSAQAARQAGELGLHFHDGALPARVTGENGSPQR